MHLPHPLRESMGGVCAAVRPPAATVCSRKKPRLGARVAVPETLPQERLSPPLIVIAAGVCAALHVGKLPPAIGTLQRAFDLSLVQAGFLLSLVQLAGMAAGIAFGAWADSMGLRRSVVVGLSILALASAAGGLASTSEVLLVSRAVEGFGFLLVVLPAPALLRRLVAPRRVNSMIGLWGAYMPFGAALGLLAGPVWIEHLGWRSWWWCIAALSAAMAGTVAMAVPSSPRAHSPASASSWPARLRTTLSRPGPWLVAMTFAVYSGQWLAVIGFLPTIYLRAGVSGAATGVLTAMAAAVNMIGNIAAGRLLQHGVRPASLIGAGFVTMGCCSVAAFAGGDGGALPAWARYVAVLGFSMVGGLIPAALFSTALRVAPDEQTIATTVGWMQQWSALGQFAGPPMVAWVAMRAGDWQWTWVTTGAMCLAGLLLTWRLATETGR
jgi:CP family cyanate transporter-like MFS transporter